MLFDDVELYMGIDPGLDGGIVIWQPGLTTPTWSARATDYLKHPHHLADLMKTLSYSEPRGGVVGCALEALPKAHPGERGVNSAITMGTNWGYLHMALLAASIPVVTPLPAAWQKDVLGEKRLRKHKDTKEAAIAWAKAHMPGLNLRPGKCRKDHDGLADAACLAYYAMKQDIFTGVDE